MLPDISEDQIGRDRCGLVEADLAPFALDVVFLSKGEAAVGLHRRLGGVPTRFRSQQLGHIGVRTAFLAVVEQGSRTPADHLCRLELGPGAGERELHPLVLADRPIEDDALLGVFDALLE